MNPNEQWASAPNERPFFSSEPNEGDEPHEDGRALWGLGVLWIVRVTGAQTSGRQALLEARMPQGFVMPPHRHEREDESFTVIEGELLFSLGEGDDERVVRAGAGSFVWIPPGTRHEFRVESAGARVFNAFAPAGLEKMIAEISVPARAFVATFGWAALRPRSFARRPQRTLRALRRDDVKPRRKL